MFCNVSVYWPPYLVVFIINTGYLLSELLKAIELGQLRAQSCVILRDGGRGTRCLRLSIVRSTTQTLHYRHTLTLYYCRVWNHPDSSPQTYNDGDVVSSMNQRTLCSHWPAGVWAESTAGQQRGTQRPVSHSRTGRDLRGQRHRECGLTPRPHVSQCQSDVHHTPESTLGKTVSNRDKGKSSAQVSAEPKITLACVTKSLAFF